MKVNRVSFWVKAMFSVAAFLNGALGSNGESINFHSVPITTAIQNLAQLAQVNYIIDPKLFLNADGSSKPEPSLTMEWQCAAAEALARVVKENNLVMTTNAFTTVVRITGTNCVANPVDTKLLGSDTNGVIPLIYFADVPLDQALKSIINQGHLAIVLDSHMSGEASLTAPDFKMAMMPMVSLRWHDLTARQVLVELCENYDLTIVKGSSPDSLLIKPVK
jgi:hypothetical protein